MVKTIAAYQIKKLSLAPRSKQFIKLTEAKNVGIVFNASQAEEFEAVKKLIQQLKEYTKAIHAVGYVNSKHIPNYSYIKTDIDLFGKKEVNWLHKPQNRYINAFINEERDLLIDINSESLMPLQFIVAQSKAKCKVGMQHTEEDIQLHDVLIATRPGQGIDFYMQQVIKYLS